MAEMVYDHSCRMTILFCEIDHVFLVSEEHPWIKGQAPDKRIDSAVLSRMKQFRAMNKLKKLALKVRLFLHVYLNVHIQFVES